MGLFRRKPRINELVYGNLMTSFGRVVDLDPMLRGPAEALADRIVSEHRELVGALDAKTYKTSTAYHLRLLAGSWIMAAEGSVPRHTAEVFEEAVAWKFSPLVPDSGKLAHAVSALARGEGPRDLRRDS